MPTPEQSFAHFRDSGDAAALAAVFDAVATELLLIAAHLAPRGSEAEDLVQATFVAAIEKADRWDAQRPLVPWLAGILVNQAREERRRAAREPDAARLKLDDVRDPLAEAELHEASERVQAALRELPTDYRQVLTLKLVHGLTPTEIAHALDCPIATVKTRLQRGLARLRSALPAGIGAAVMAIAVGGRGLAAVRQAVLAQAPVAAGAGATVAGGVASLAGGVVMKKAGLAVGAAVLGATMWLAWPSSAPATQAGADEAPPANLTAATPATKPPQPDAAAPSAGADTLARAALPDGASMLRGRVVDPLGAPLEGIELELGSTRVDYLSSLDYYLCHHSGNPTWIAPSPGNRARSDRDGRFAFDRARLDGPSVVAAWSPTRGAALQAVPERQDEELVLVLPDHGQLHGRVLAKGGGGLADLTVHVYPKDSGMFVVVARTDEQGRYRTVPLPPGTKRLTVRSDAHEDGMALTEHFLATDTEVDLPLTPLPVLSAQLVDAARRPWTGDRITTVCGVAATEIELLLSSPALTRYVRAEASAIPCRRLAFEPRDGSVRGVVPTKRPLFVSAWWRGVKLAEAALPAADAKAIELQLERPQLVQVQVDLAFEPAAAAMPATKIALARPDGHHGETLSEEAMVRPVTPSASLQVPLLPKGSAMWLVVEAAGYRSHHELVVLPPGSLLARRSITMRAASTALRGIVVDEAGEPVEKAVVCVLRADGRLLGVGNKLRVWTDRDGAFVLADLPEEPLRLLATSRDWSSNHAAVQARPGPEPVRIVLGKTQWLEVKLGSHTGCKLRVLGPEDQVLVDDRAQGSVRYGSKLRVAVRGTARIVEAYEVAAGVPWARGEVRAGESRVELQAVDR